MVNTMALRAITSLLILSIASYMDVKHREIDRRIWLLMTALGGLFLLLDITSIGNIRLFALFLFILSLAVLFSVSLHYLGLIGGGDAKMLIGLGAMYPYLPSGSFLLPAFFLSVFTNAVVIALVIPLLFFLMNLKLLREVKSIKEFIRLFVGYKKSSKDVGSFEAVLEENQLFVNTKTVELGKISSEGEVWVTPAFPFVVFITAGFLISILYGDLIKLVL